MFPIGALRDSWTWRDLVTGEPLIVLLEERVQCLRRIHALHTRDLNRTGRLDPPIWEGTTMSFAAKVLDLPSLPQGPRSPYEMNFTGQWATTPPRKPTLSPPGPTSSHARCARLPGPT